jgi:hypothetical protein
MHGIVAKLGMLQPVAVYIMDAVQRRSTVLREAKHDKRERFAQRVEHGIELRPMLPRNTEHVLL